MLYISKLPLFTASMVWFFWCSPNFCVVYHHWIQQWDKLVGIFYVYLGIFICLFPPPKITLGNHFMWWEGANCLCFWPLRTVVLFDWHRSALRQRKAQGRVIKAAPPGGGRPVPPPCMIWETLISLGTGIPCQMHIEFFILISQNFLELWRG